MLLHNRGLFLGHISTASTQRPKHEYIYSASTSWKWYREAGLPACVYGYIEQMAMQHGHISHTGCLAGSATHVHMLIGRNVGLFEGD